MSQPFVPPILNATAFNCPYCNAYARQIWGKMGRFKESQLVSYLENFSMATCDHCGEVSFWKRERLVIPRAYSSPEPNPDMPDSVVEDYQEARKIIAESPRGAAALLRLAVQKLCKELGEKGKNINEDIASLVAKGLPIQIQQALDIVRVVGNNAVHPGVINFDDKTDTANKLFGLVNMICEVMISQPKHIALLYENLVPQTARESISKRDGA